MGTWGLGVYDNDDAADFAFEVAEGDGLEPVLNALVAVENVGQEYLEAPEAQRALAAADIVASLGGQPTVGDIPDELRAFLAERSGQGDDALLRRALAVVDRVMTAPSELQELWLASDEFEEWRAQVENLRSRLSQA